MMGQNGCRFDVRMAEGTPGCESRRHNRVVRHAVVDHRGTLGDASQEVRRKVNLRVAALPFDRLNALAQAAAVTVFEDQGAARCVLRETCVTEHVEILVRAEVRPSRLLSISLIVSASGLLGWCLMFRHLSCRRCDGLSLLFMTSGFRSRKRKHSYGARKNKRMELYVNLLSLPKALNFTIALHVTQSPCAYRSVEVAFH